MIDVTERAVGALIGARIRGERERLGWSQQQLAIQAGVDRSWIASIETGNAGDPSASRVLAVARAMGSDLHYLLTGERREPSPEAQPIVRRLLDQYTPDELTAFEAGISAIFLRLRRGATDTAAEERGDAKRRNDRPDPDADAEDLGAAER